MRCFYITVIFKPYILLDKHSKEPRFIYFNFNDWP